MESSNIPDQEVQMEEEEEQKPILMDPYKSVIDVSNLTNKKEGISCSYCGSKDKTRFRMGFKTTKLSVYHLETLIEKGFSKRGGTTIEKGLNDKSCCHIFNPRVGITEFKISKQQKKHMKRFNQYMNGQRELKIEPVKYSLHTDKQVFIGACMRNGFQKDIASIDNWVKSGLVKTLNSDDQKISSALTEDLKGMLKLRIKIDFSEDIYNLESFTEQEEVQLVMTCDLKALFAKHKLDDDFMSAFFPVFMSNLREDQDLCELYEITENCKEYAIQISGDKRRMSGYQHNLDRQEDLSKYEPDIYGEKRYKVTGEESKLSVAAGNKREYTEFFKEFCPNPVPKEERKHHYTVSLHPAIFTPESFEIYKLFDKEIFDKDTASESYERFLCSSSLFDPKDPREIKTFKDGLKINGNNKFVDSGVYPEFLGSYHLYHRIDGALFAVSAIDILPHNLISAFCMYHPAYKCLSPGHFTAIREIEYMLMIREKFNENMRYYSQMDIVVGCPKTEYKEHVKPVYLKCPLSLDWVLLTKEIKEKIASKNYNTLDESSAPVSPPKVEEFFKWIGESVIHTQTEVLPLNAIVRSVLEDLILIFKEIGSEMNEMFCLEHK
ncbi:unnamed protein product [Moneuplotes crassus]|uniref:Arginyl-tRNA--protein transferase 1 n=1 Tax=Euplotes crassus TaxID=5936 RepID=A0AAD1X820_EUPCR|nr:unnamed protein product [Moneuplotes crassus]